MMKFIIVLISFSLLATANTVSAAETLCGGDALGSLFCGTDLSSMLNVAFQTSIYVGAVLAMLRIGYAGFLYMGNDIWSDKTKAKEVFSNAIIGLLLLLAVWMILYQINPEILSLKLLSSSSETSGSAGGAAPSAITGCLGRGCIP